MDNASNQKQIKKWVLLLVLPTALLVVMAILQIIVNFVLTTSTSPEAVTTGNQDTLKLVINVISLAVGIVAICVAILTPLWLVLLVRDLKGQPRSKVIAVVLAIFFGYFAWLYTWEKNSRKFWINLGLTFLTIGYWSFVGWIWAIIDNAKKPEEYFLNYHNSSKEPLRYPEVSS